MYLCTIKRTKGESGPEVHPFGAPLSSCFRSSSVSVPSKWIGPPTSSLPTWSATCPSCRSRERCLSSKVVSSKRWRRWGRSEAVARKRLLRETIDFRLLTLDQWPFFTLTFWLLNHEKIISSNYPLLLPFTLSFTPIFSHYFKKIFNFCLLAFKACTTQPAWLIALST